MQIKVATCKLLQMFAKLKIILQNN